MTTTIDLSSDTSGVNVAENKMTLINGCELCCFPKPQQPGSVAPDELRIDTTGEYLTVGNRRPVKRRDDERQTDKKFFTDHAFFFFRHASSILKDSRMFLAPVPVQSGLAYVGASGFHAPTLGVYIEWWLYGEGNATTDSEGREALTYAIAGSPLSGRNSCACVYPDGSTATISHASFQPLWRDFVRINKRYNEAKARYEAYTLQEVWEQLSAAEEDPAAWVSTQLLIQEGRYAILLRKLNRLKEQYEALSDKYDEVCITLHHERLEAFAQEYLRRKEKLDARLTELKAMRKAYRSQLKQNRIDNIAYQKLLRPLAKERERLTIEWFFYERKEVDRLLEHGDITRDMIYKFIQRKR